VINASLDQYFPVSSGVRIIAEPGTFFARSPFTIVTNIIAVKEMSGKQIEHHGMSLINNNYQKVVEQNIQK